ncbi:MAG: hypothetical protein M3Q52_06585, partial [Pseudomonadota bacterium]|nr:hypothetical protein [Pseudomonadota bacterium]
EAESGQRCEQSKAAKCGHCGGPLSFRPSEVEMPGSLFKKLFYARNTRRSLAAYNLRFRR